MSEAISSSVGKDVLVTTTMERANSGIVYLRFVVAVRVIIFINSAPWMTTVEAVV